MQLNAYIAHPHRNLGRMDRRRINAAGIRRESSVLITEAFVDDFG